MCVTLERVSVRRFLLTGPYSYIEKEKEQKINLASSAFVLDRTSLNKAQ